MWSGQVHVRHEGSRPPAISLFTGDKASPIGAGNNTLSDELVCRVASGQGLPYPSPLMHHAIIYQDKAIFLFCQYWPSIWAGKGDEIIAWSLRSAADGYELLYGLIVVIALGLEQKVVGMLAGLYTCTSKGSSKGWFDQAVFHNLLFECSRLRGLGFLRGIAAWVHWVQGFCNHLLSTLCWLLMLSLGISHNSNVTALNFTAHRACKHSHFSCLLRHHYQILAFSVCDFTGWLQWAVFLWNEHFENGS